MRKTKHVAMAQRPDMRINCPIGKLVDGRIITPETCDTITQTRNTITRADRHTITQTRNTITQQTVLKISDALFRTDRYVVFKSDIPNTVDVYKIQPDKKLQLVACIMRDKEKYALGAAKKILLTKV